MISELKNQNKIAIISFGYLWFPHETGTSRFYQIANVFANSGWEVECITTSFQHFEKKPRDIEKIKEQNYPYKITFIETPRYNRNIGIRRHISNIVASKRLKNYLKGVIQEYDAIYVSIPANNISACVTKLAHKNKIPVIVDIEDLWPEAMAIIIRNERIRNVLFYSFLRDAEITYRYASGIIGTSQDYTERAFKKRNRTIQAETVYVGCDIKCFDEGVKYYQNRVEKDDSEIWITYTGSISNSYDIKTLIDAGNILKDTNIHIQILGTGTNMTTLREYSKDMKNIHFWGFVKYQYMAAVLAKSDIVINSFVIGAKQSVVNKIGDYLASGKPMINTLENMSFCRFVENNKIGINVVPGNAELLAEEIQKLALDKKLRYELGFNARCLAEKSFDRNVIYHRITEFVKTIVCG